MGTAKILLAPLLARNQTMRARSEHLRQAEKTERNLNPNGSSPGSAGEAAKV
jgi:hypothetical protein